MRRNGLSLEGRLLAASVALAMLVAAVFVALILAITTLHETTNQEAESKDVTVSALQLERLVLDIQNSMQSYVIAGRKSLLAPFSSARKALPEKVRQFQREARAEDRAQGQRARVLGEAINAYANYLDALLTFTGEERLAAARDAMKVEAKIEVDDIRNQFVKFHAAEDARAAMRADSASTSAQRAIAFGIAGLAASAALIILFGLYLARSIARPVRDAAAGAARFAGGDLSTRLKPGGPGEVGELTSSFNEMAERLAQARSELEAQNAQLRESERLKTELVNIVSHELRTPLASVLGFTSVLLTRDFDSETRRHYLGIIDAQARRLSGLIDDFLDVRRIEEGRFELEHELLDMAALLREEALLYSGQSREHQVELDLPDEPLPVRGDPDRLRQVIGNLLSNAIKYSPGGGTVELAAARNGDSVHISVRDEGIGIPETSQSRIFTKFFRGEMATSGISGTGLGLAVSRDIVESHGGRMGFMSAEGEGTTFWVELPKGNGQEGRLPANEPEDS